MIIFEFETSGEIIHEYHLWVLEEGLMLVAKISQGSLTYGNQSTASGLVEGIWVMGVGIFIESKAMLYVPSL